MRRLHLAPALFLLAAIAPGFARADQDRASFGHDITIQEGQTASDIACAFCSVRVHGKVNGDVAVLFGTVSVDNDHAIAGDVAILGGDLNLREDAMVGGDVAIVAGTANLAQDAAIHGDRMIMPGRFWLLLPLAPLLILIGIIWLIVYVVQRNRYRPPVYPQRRAF